MAARPQVHRDAADLHRDVERGPGQTGGLEVLRDAALAEPRVLVGAPRSFAIAPQVVVAVGEGLGPAAVRGRDELPAPVVALDHRALEAAVADEFAVDRRDIAGPDHEPSDARQKVRHDLANRHEQAIHALPPLLFGFRASTCPHDTSADGQDVHVRKRLFGQIAGLPASQLIQESDHGAVAGSTGCVFRGAITHKGQAPRRSKEISC